MLETDHNISFAHQLYFDILLPGKQWLEHRGNIIFFGSAIEQLNDGLLEGQLKLVEFVVSAVVDQENELSGVDVVFV